MRGGGGQESMRKRKELNGVLNNRALLYKRSVIAVIKWPSL